MEQIAKSLGAFFRRDFIFLMSGSFFVFSVVFTSELIEGKMSENLSLVYIGAFASYMLGYFWQEIFAFFGLVDVRECSRVNRVFLLFNSRISQISKKSSVILKIKR